MSVSRFQGYHEEERPCWPESKILVVFRKWVCGLLLEYCFFEKNEVTLSMRVGYYYRQLDEVGLLGLAAVLVLASDLLGAIVGRGFAGSGFGREYELQIQASQ